ncbi:MAG: RNA polymerase factor sigma-54 [Alphaproteobacteria bacterium]|nr:RNA polymerase factor sigma-54 [Alphaproteobacteria bacterium]
MAITPRLEIKQSQSLNLTAQLRQAIGLLALSNLEMNEVIEQELANNPLLEREETSLADTPDETPQTIDDYDAQLTDDDTFSPPEADYQNDCDDYGSDTEGYETFETADWSDYNQAKVKRTDDDAFDYFEQRLSKEKSLFEILDEQINLKFTVTSDRLIAKILSEHLDNAGYFRGDITTIAAKLKTSPERLKKILTILKTFEPSGIFAESLEECLKIQLTDQNMLTQKLEILLANLPLLANRKFKELETLCSCSQKDIMSMVSLIKTLNPKPTAHFFADAPQSIIPDVFVKQSSLGGYRVELNNMTLPRLLINHAYYADMQKDKSAKKYLKEKLSRASLLLKAMHQRAVTILSIAEEIVLRQYAFLEKGIEFLKPLALKDVAEALNISESTVSRVTNGKYIETPRGLFELKYFFSIAAKSYTGDDNTSTTTIKHKIKVLIENEKPDHILSDDDLSALLGQQGIKIARRTIAKYREAMGIPTSAVRKRTKRG